ncbi:hypothetical protein [Profundibacter amoris]|uniref:Uncharacterized protein n=1 Tax=Profundibacter amoris TaxID=2171755 RepID=A0A347UI29_9RHOB|nr:hypothetical protein [Profundibacter amoris]AXX98507.1 hypothetical protein BAR1_11595 [Profundibacter amoris]
MNVFAKLALLGLAAIVLGVGFVKGRDYLADRKIAKEIAISREVLARLPASDYVPLRDMSSNDEFNIRDLSNTEYGDFRDITVIGPDKHVILSFFNSSNIRSERDWTSVILDKTLAQMLVTQTGERLRIFNNYILRPEGYYTFLMDGSTALIPYEVYTPDGPVTEEVIRGLYENSLYYRYDEYAILNERQARTGSVKAHVFYVDGRWLEIRADRDLETGFSNKGQDDLAANETGRYVELLAPRYGDEEKSASLNGGLAGITLDHFLKEKFYKGRGPVWGSPTGGSLSEAWSGQAFYTLETGGKALKFVWPHLQRARTKLYSDPASGFILLASKIGRYYALVSPKTVVD